MNRPYTGSRLWGSEYKQQGSRFQNNNPVASQFRADPQPKLTQRKRPEVAIDPLSDRTKRRILSEGGNLCRLTTAIKNGGRVIQNTPSNSKNFSHSTSSTNSLTEGAIIEHQRFGIGKVIKVEGVGENVKATVDFQNIGQKQLLLKFAKYKIL